MTVGGANATEEFFLKSGSRQLEKIHAWARARYTAPWAVFFSVLQRVAASVPPTVQLPAVIGDRASLNLLCAFVGQSGTGKGNSAKVAAKAWPADIVTLPIGSGQGIAETFTKRADSDEVRPVIFDAPEIDTLAGLASTHGSILLPTVKSLAMGEQLGQANATKDNRRNVPAHSYRACLSVGAQPGHTDVIFNDTTGGTPQRFLWVPVTDPNIPDGEFSDPEPLSMDMPIWVPGSDGVVEVDYSIAEIRQSIRAAHLARQRGDGDALDGHALLTRCKVAALLAIMHGRVELTEWDWRRSEAVMAVSDEARRDVIQAAEEIKRQQLYDAGHERALRSAGFEAGRIQTAMRAIVEQLGRHGANGASRNHLRSSLSTANRAVFDSAVQKLAEDGTVQVIKVARGNRYRLGDGCQGGSPCQGALMQVKEDGSGRQGGSSDNVMGIENRTSQKAGRHRIGCQKWFDGYLEDLRTHGHETVEGFAVRKAGVAAGYSMNSLYVAAHKRGLKGDIWSLPGSTRAEG